MQGIMGSGKPRAEVDGTATFVDEQHGLCGLLHFCKCCWHCGLCALRWGSWRLL